jgi:hypothetical protein
VVVVTVGDERGVDPRQLRRRDGRGHVPADADDPLRPQHRIDEERHAVELDEEGGVPEPGQPRRRPRRRRRGDGRAIDRRGRDHGARRRRAAPAGDPIPERPAQDVAEARRPAAVEVEEAAGGRAGLGEGHVHIRRRIAGRGRWGCGFTENEARERSPFDRPRASGARAATTSRNDDGERVAALPGS